VAASRAEGEETQRRASPEGRSRGGEGAPEGRRRSGGRAGGQAVPEGRSHGGESTPETRQFSEMCQLDIWPVLCNKTTKNIMFSM